jgi:hypothetical protein
MTLNLRLRVTSSSGPQSRFFAAWQAALAVVGSEPVVDSWELDGALEGLTAEVWWPISTQPFAYPSAWRQPEAASRRALGGESRYRPIELM